MLSKIHFGDKRSMAFVTAIVPVWREHYRCFYDPTDNYKPKYTKFKEENLQENLIFGLLTT
jgi:hypothetical protein